jgi:hypothetical protein
MKTEKRYWLDDRRNVRKVYVGLWIVSLVLLGIDLVYTKKVEFAVEGLFGFVAFFGFVGFAGLVFGGRLLRTLVKRDEDYYER